jgi:uncharacterized protein
MPSQTGERSDHFPAIEKRYGQPMSYWFGILEERAGQSYKELFAFLTEDHGFSKAHANALAMYVRGSTSSKRFATVDDYLAAVDPVGAETIRSIFAAIRKVHSDLEPVVAWNQPMLRKGDDYVIGFSVLTNHVLLGPWGEHSLAAATPHLGGYKVNKKTVQVPLDWDVDAHLLLAMVDSRLAELTS